MSLTSMGKNGLQVESVPLSEVAQRFGTPCYVYSRAALTAAYGAYRDALQAHGLGDEDIIDLLHACAIFGWANRLMHNLGEPAGEAG